MRSRSSTIEAAVLGAMLGALGCSDPPATPPSATAQTVPSATPSPAADDPSAIPEDWVWVTETRGKLEVAMPSLPTSASSRPADPHSPRARMLTARRSSATYTVTVQPDSAPEALVRLRGAIEQQGRVSGETPWQTDGFGVTVATAAGEVRVRAVVHEGRLYVLEVSGPAPAVDSERFFSSFSPRDTPRAEELSSPRRRYRVQAPARMGAWRDTSGIPPLVGHRAVLDGHQLVVHANELVLVPDPEQSLDGSVTEMRRSMNGTIVEIDPRPFDGRPSRRLELRASDGIYATIRVVLDGTRLVMAAVYAPSGTEAPWADAFVDSLSPEPASAP